MAAAAGVSQGSFGYCKLNSTVVLVRPGASLAMPRNPDMPHPINGAGNAGIVNHADGLHFPVVNIPTIPMDTGAENWLSAAAFNALFVTKSASPVGDLSELTNLFISDNGSVGNGIGSYKINKAKGAGFSLVCRKGQGIGLNLRFAGRNITKAVGGDRPTVALLGSPLMFDRVALGTEMDGRGIVGFTINYDTALTPNMELDGTLYPVEQNAGLPTCSITIEYNALDTVSALGFDLATNSWVDVDDVDFSLQTVSGGSPVTMVFTLSRLKIRNPFDRQTQANRVQRTFSYDVIGKSTSVPYPLGIA